MGKPIPIIRDRHKATAELLPWFVTGGLEGFERAEVEAHLASCPRCQADLVLERALKSRLQALSPTAVSDWEALRVRLKPRIRAPWRGPVQTLRRGAAVLWRPRALGWMIAAPACLALTVVMVGPGRRTGPPAYHGLSATPARGAGNMLIMFRPDAREADIRAALLASGARMVDGPTPADAYVLATPADRRPGALASLRRQAVVAMAEPIDAPSP